ncbi:MAG: 6-oxocyclohex-1-ene-1-carbonyl-CoA hydratase [Proteobacteria bacterium]|nr:6-oxocyclohex-1-ene-1-carbonyl-CoA hydratase [Pseudomonadota bacterium]
MSLDWIPREGGIKNHDLWGDEHFTDEAPGIKYELKPIINPKTQEVVEGLFSAWITLNNPRQYNSYTTPMVKGVIAGMHRASMDRKVVAVIFTGAGDKAFCTGGNTKEYSEYYAQKPTEYALYMDLFNAMVDSILNCKKPVICRVNGMRIAGGQEIGMACDLALSSDVAIFGQAGPKHGSAPVGGSVDFLPWMLPIEQAMWNCISCEMWSAYKMKRLGLISKCVPILKHEGEWVRNPGVIVDKYVDDGEIVYGEFKTGQDAKDARAFVKAATTDFSRLDAEIGKILWTFTNLFPHCLQMSIDMVRQKKKTYWDATKGAYRHWLATNMSSEAYLGFTAFNTKKITGTDTIDFIKYRQLLSECRIVDDSLFEEVLGKPQ